MARRAAKFSLKTHEPAAAMSTAEFLATCECSEMVLDAVEDNISKEENAENFLALEAFMNEATDAELVQFITGNEDLSQIFDGDVKKFRDFIKAEIGSENFLRDAALNGLIMAFLQRNDATIDALKPVIEQCKKVMAEADEKKFKTPTFLALKISSKYLPKRADWPAACKAITALANYLKSCKPDNFDIEKAHDCLKGSIFLKGTKEKKNSSKGNWLYFIPIVAWFKWFADTADIRTQKGWGAKKDFDDGLKDCDELIKAMETVDAVAKGLKDQQGDNVKGMLHCCKFVTSEAGHLARGMTVATKKICSGILGKIFGQLTNS